MRKNKRVIAYLCQKRGIEYRIVLELLSSGKLFQDERGNCNFVIFDADGNQIGAEVHGTGDTRFKGQTARRNGFGFTLLSSSGYDAVETVCYFESAIDLLSFYQIYQHECIYDYLLVSLGGLTSSVVRNYVKLFPSARHLLFVDHDQAGRNFAVEMNMHVKYPPFGKDWNEYLQIRLKRGN